MMQSETYEQFLRRKEAEIVAAKNNTWGMVWIKADSATSSAGTGLHIPTGTGAAPYTIKVKTTGGCPPPYWVQPWLPSTLPPQEAYVFAPSGMPTAPAPVQAAPKREPTEDEKAIHRAIKRGGSPQIMAGNGRFDATRYMTDEDE
jgi:hypothetical protein